jgi:hypothetical protein
MLAQTGHDEITKGAEMVEQPASRFTFTVFESFIAE